MFGSNSEDDPLFERQGRGETQYQTRMQEELMECKLMIEVGTKRQNELEYVNDDLERRLEAEARGKHVLERLLAEAGEEKKKQTRKHEEEVHKWKSSLQDEIHRRGIVEERLRRAEKELYRMHQKKYDIERNVRMEEDEKRKTQAVIMQDIKQESLKIHNSNVMEQRPSTIRTKQAMKATLDFFGF